MITREQIADLRKGDVVELRDEAYPAVVVRGPATKILGNSFEVGNLAWCADDDWTLTVIERAPRPLYVNHDRAEPVPGDVVRDADEVLWVREQNIGRGGGWWWSPSTRRNKQVGHPDCPHLLVDGETGQVVP